MYIFFCRFASFVGVYTLFFFPLLAQYPDNHWLLGYSSFVEENNGFGLVQLYFTNNQLMVSEEMEVVIDLDRNISLISSPSGDSILFYFNGLQVNNGAHELAVNGGGMYYGELSLGYDPTQGSLVLPIPEQPGNYALLSTYRAVDEELVEIYNPELNLSIISTQPEVEILVKNQTVAEDRLFGFFTATRHANGRDWWILWPFLNSNRYLRFLLTPEGLIQLEDQYFSQPINSGSGQFRFSPDGRYFAMHNGISGELGNYFDLFDFDRCTGLLSNQRQYHMDNYGGGIGLEISHDSHFLYISASWYIYQFDLWAEDVFASIDTVTVYDGGADPFPTRFNEAQLARDGKIYLSATGSMKKLHVMDYPNRRGAACNVRQRGIRLPVRMSFGVPNFPFHRLGPIDGSPCDTLGIDNVPLADFRSDQDSSDYRQFFFQNLSTYEPATWSWSFGDGSMSQDTSPVHTYAQGGSYEVCLTVSNEYGTDTTCDSLYLAVVNSTAATIPQVEWQLFPNPAQDYFTFNLLDYYPREAYLELYNSIGQRVRRERVFAGWNTVEVRNLPSGVYSYVFLDNGKRLGAGKVVKVE